MSGPAVLVIGAGALGLASAWHLHERGVTDITVVDGAYPAAKSSGLSVGIVQTQHLRKIDIDMRVVSRRFLDRLERDHDLEVQRTGYLRLGFSSADLAVFEASVEMQRQHGITHPRVLTPAQVADLVPEMNTDDVVGGLFGPNDGYIDGHIYCGIMVAHLASHGVPVRSQSQVVRADRVPDGRHRVTTTRDTYEVDYVVNAAGAWAPNVARMFGQTIPVRPERHQAIMVRLGQPMAYTLPCVMTYSPGSETDGIFVRRETDDQLVAGFHSLDPIGEVVDPDNYPAGNDLAFLERFADHFEHRFPGFTEAAPGRGWSGVYPVSPDGLPFVGPHVDDPTVIAACSAGGAGIMLSPFIGNLVADWIVDQSSELIDAAAKLLPTPSRLAASMNTPSK